MDVKVKMSLKLKFQKIGRDIQEIGVFVESHPCTKEPDFQVILRRDTRGVMNNRNSYVTNFNSMSVDRNLILIPDFIIKNVLEEKYEPYEMRKNRKVRSSGEFGYVSSYNDRRNICYEIYWKLP